MQAKHPRTGKISNQNALPPSSSLRLKGLAQARGSLTQASSLRLGESSTHRNSGLCAFSLRRDTPRLSETLARSKLSWSPEWPLAWKVMGESLLISPRQGKLAWVRLSDLATIFLQQPHIPIQTNILKPSMHSQHHTNHRLVEQQQNNRKNEIHE